MQLIINIDEEIYSDIKKGKIYNSYYDVPLESVAAIANGTPLMTLTEYRKCTSQNDEKPSSLGKNCEDYTLWQKESEAKTDGTIAENIAKAFQLGLAFGFGEKHDEMDKIINAIKIDKAWIPVNEKLPEEGKIVIASTKYCIYYETRYTKTNGWEWAYDLPEDIWIPLSCVNAWMPQLEPYEEENKEEKK